MTESVEASPTRKVRFVVVQDGGIEERLREAIGVPPDVGRSGINERHNQAWWEIGQDGSGHDDVSALINLVLAQVGSLREQLSQVCGAADTTCRLRVVQYVRNDPVGPGFALTADQVALLGELHAFVDVDQHWLDPGSE